MSALIFSPWLFTFKCFLVDMAKRAGWVGSIGSWVKTGHMSKRVNRVAGQMGRGLSQVDPYFSIFFFVFFFFCFDVDAICQLFMSSLTVIRFLLVILLPITTKHLT